MAQVGEVHAHLVRPAGVQLGLHQRSDAEPFERPNHRARLASAAPGAESGATRPWVRTADGALDVLVGCQVAGDQRLVAALDAVGLELPLQVLGGAMVARQHEHAGGVAVEAVHDVDALAPPAAPRQLGHRPRDHRVALAFEGRVDEQAGGLDDHQDVGVEVEHLERRSARRRDPSRQLRPVLDRVALADERAGIGRHRTVHRDVPDFDLALRPRVAHREASLDDAGKAPLAAGLFEHARSVSPDAAAAVRQGPVGRYSDGWDGRGMAAEQERDYILRVARQIAMIVVRLMGLKERGDLPTATQTLEEGYELLLGAHRRWLRGADPATVAQILGSAVAATAFARLELEEGELLELAGNPGARERWRHALELCELLGTPGAGAAAGAERDWLINALRARLVGPS